MKKIISLVLALCMVLTIGAAFAAVGEIAVDTEVKVTGLDDGDTVKLYKVLEWAADSENKNDWSWKATSDFASLADSVLKPFIDNETNASANFSGSDLAAIATVAQTKNPIDTQTLSGTKIYTYTVNAANATPVTAGAGMYLALVTPKNAGVVYNPIIISADFTQKTGEDETSSIDSSATIEGTSVAKRQELTIEKTEPKITNDIADVYDFTITTQIPGYSTAYEDQFFKVTDKLSSYLDVIETSIESSVDGGQVTIIDEGHGFTMYFPDSVVRNLGKATNLTITYKAKLNVPVDDVKKLTTVKEEYNKVTVEFPNDPSDLSGKTITALKDETREYTFTLDGKIFGHEDWISSELVKIGVDVNGETVVAKQEYDSGEWHGPLEGAKYGLYTTKAAAEAAAKENKEDDQKAGLYTNGVFNGFVTTDKDGLMQISGLDAGEYWLIELSAPAGYVRDTKAHHIKITANINGDETGEKGEKVTEYYTVSEDADGNPVVTWHDEAVTGSTPYTYYVPVLTSYTVTVDNTNVSTYTFDHDGPSLKYDDKTVKDSELVNTKGTELPHTGGIGTTIFYILGGLLVVGAAVILIARRKAQD